MVKRRDKRKRKQGYFVYYLKYKKCEVVLHRTSNGYIKLKEDLMISTDLSNKLVKIETKYLYI